MTHDFGLILVFYIFYFIFFLDFFNKHFNVFVRNLIIYENIIFLHALSVIWTQHLCVSVHFLF